jgi:hypothetical protein
MEVSGQFHAMAALPAEWAPQPVWTLWWKENLQHLSGLETPISQSVAQRYTTELPGSEEGDGAVTI